ncbi:hypothetical protein [Virgibacillus salexigens]|uniref:hypothetical protein n=1 Tax=Virgibacillus salexigens TaxID=61016 RepID=UPI00190D59E9|nr:hypothetical protein [Virgibacillus salexigens]
MKNLLYICLSISLLILSACGDNSEENEQNMEMQDNDSKVEQDQTTSDQDNKGSNDDGMFSMGEFKTLKGKNDVGTYETGPISLTIKSVAVKRGELNENYPNDRLPEGEIEFIEILMTMTSEKDNINFTEDNFQLTTNSGENFSKPEGLMSTALNIDFAYSGSETGPEDYYVTVAYILEQSKAESLEEVNFHVKAPTDQSGNSLDKDINVDIPVSSTGSE